MVALQQRLLLPHFLLQVTKLLLRHQVTGLAWTLHSFLTLILHLSKLARAGKGEAEGQTAHASTAEAVQEGEKSGQHTKLSTTMHPLAAHGLAPTLPIIHYQGSTHGGASVQLTWVLTQGPAMSEGQSTRVSEVRELLCWILSREHRLGRWLGRGG